MKRVLGCLALGLVTIAASAQWSNPADDIPAYNRGALLKTAPPLLAGDQLTGPYFSHSYQTTAYVMAGKIPGVIQPDAVLLPLRPGAGTQEPAQLL